MASRACLPTDEVIVGQGVGMVRAGVLSDAMWARAEPLLPSSQGKCGRPFRDHRQVLEGIVYRLRTGVPWRDLPVEFGPWQTVWKRHARFSRDGTWDAVLTRLLAEADAAGQLDWAVSVDSTVVRAHQHSATAPAPSGRPQNRTSAPRRAHGRDWREFEAALRRLATDDADPVAVEL